MDSDADSQRYRQHRGFSHGTHSRYSIGCHGADRNPKRDQRDSHSDPLDANANPDSNAKLDTYAKLDAKSNRYFDSFADSSGACDQ
jgi:hypothetical protein